MVLLECDDLAGDAGGVTAARPRAGRSVGVIVVTVSQYRIDRPTAGAVVPTKGSQQSVSVLVAEFDFGDEFVGVGSPANRIQHGEGLIGFQEVFGDGPAQGRRLQAVDELVL